MKNWITTTRWKAATFFVPPLWSLIKILDKRERSYIFFLSILTHLSPLYIVHESNPLSWYENLKFTTCSFIDMHTIFTTKFPSSQGALFPIPPSFFPPLLPFLFFLSPSPFFPSLPASLFVCLKGWHGFCEKVEKNEQNREKVRIWFSLLTTDGVVDENRFNKRI